MRHQTPQRPYRKSFFRAPNDLYKNAGAKKAIVLVD